MLSSLQDLWRPHVRRFLSCFETAFNRCTCDHWMTCCIHKKWKPHTSERIDLCAFILASGEVRNLVICQKNRSAHFLFQKPVSAFIECAAIALSTTARPAHRHRLPALP